MVNPWSVFFLFLIFSIPWKNSECSSPWITDFIFTIYFKSILIDISIFMILILVSLHVIRSESERMWDLAAIFISAALFLNWENILDSLLEFSIIHLRILSFTCLNFSKRNIFAVPKPLNEFHVAVNASLKSSLCYHELKNLKGEGPKSVMNDLTMRVEWLKCLKGFLWMIAVGFYWNFSTRKSNLSC